MNKEKQFNDSRGGLVNEKKKYLEKAIILGLLLAVPFESAFAADLVIENESGENHLEETSDNTYEFRDADGNYYDSITFTKSAGAGSSITFLSLGDENNEATKNAESGATVNVLTDSLYVSDADGTGITIQTSEDKALKDVTYNFGTAENIIDEITIEAVKRTVKDNIPTTTRPVGQLTSAWESVISASAGRDVPDSSNEINFYANKMTVSLEGDDTGSTASGMAVAIGPYAHESTINFNVKEKLKIVGNIGSGYAFDREPSNLTFGSGYTIVGYTGKMTRPTNGTININTSDDYNGTVQIDGNIGVCNFIDSGNTGNGVRRGNSVNIVMNSADSYLTGRTLDYYYDFTGKYDTALQEEEGIHFTLLNGASWNMTNSSSLTDLTLGAGSVVDMTYNKSDSSNYRVLRVYDDLIGSGGTINMDVDASTNANNSDRIYISGTHSGTNYLALNNVGASTDGANGTVLISVNDEQGTFVANDEETKLYWNTYNLGTQDSTVDGYKTDWVLTGITRRPSTMAESILASSSLNYHTWRTENDKLLQRMGELRHNGEEAQGVWFRVKGNKIGRDGQYGFTNKYVTYELGYDVLNQKTENLTRYQGLAFSYTDGNSDYSRGSGNNHSKSLAFYNTDQYSKGHYLDVVLRISDMDNDFQSYDSMGNKVSGEFSNTGVALSAEYGRKNSLKHGWYIEPQAQLTLGYLGGNSYTTSNDIKVEQSGIKSAVGRVGFNVGKEIGEKGIIYAKANLLHEFGGGYDVDMSADGDALRYGDTLNDTWFEYGLGAAFATGKNSHIYFDVERSAGSNFHKDWQWNAGMRWNF